MGIKKEEDGSGAKPVGEDGAVDYKYVFTTRSRKLRDVFLRIGAGTNRYFVRVFMVNRFALSSL